MNDNKHSWYVYLSGWLGTGVILLSYTLNIFGYIQSEGMWYAFGTLLGSVLVGIRVYPDRNWANVALQGVFGAIALLSLFRIIGLI